MVRVDKDQTQNKRELSTLAAWEEGGKKYFIQEITSKEMELNGSRFSIPFRSWNKLRLLSLKSTFFQHF